MTTAKEGVSIRINSELKQKLVKEAKSLGIHLTDLLEYAILDKEGKSDSPIAKINAQSELLQDTNSIVRNLVKQNNEILNRIQTVKSSNKVQEPIIKHDDEVEQKLSELLERIGEDGVRYWKDGEEQFAEPKTTVEVLNLIVHNYHSLIFNQ